MLRLTIGGVGACHDGSRVGVLRGSAFESQPRLIRGSHRHSTLTVAKERRATKAEMEEKNPPSTQISSPLLNCCMPQMWWSEQVFVSPL